MKVQRVSLVDGRAERRASVWGEGMGAVQRMPDGTFLVPIHTTQASEVWYRLGANGGTPVRAGIRLPATATYRFSTNGLRGIARERVRRSDVFLLRPIE